MTSKNRIVLSRCEVMSLLFEKLELMRSECEDIVGEHGEAGVTTARLPEIRKRISRIRVESRRCQQLIEEYESVWTNGTCVHCAKKYSEHRGQFDPEPYVGTLEAEPTVKRRDANAPPPPLCRGIKERFESLELATYVAIPLAEPDE